MLKKPRHGLRRIKFLALVCVSTVLFAAPSLRAQEAPPEDEAPKVPSLHQQARESKLPRAHADFSLFHFIPKNDEVIQRADSKQLLFRRPDGTPDGYAQQRGTAIFYYDRFGNLTQVQRIGVRVGKTPEE